MHFRALRFCSLPTIDLLHLPRPCKCTDLFALLTLFCLNYRNTGQRPSLLQVLLLAHVSPLDRFALRCYRPFERFGAIDFVIRCAWAKCRSGHASITESKRPSLQNCLLHLLAQSLLPPMAPLDQQNTKTKHQLNLGTQLNTKIKLKIITVAPRTGFLVLCLIVLRPFYCAA